MKINCSQCGKTLHRKPYQLAARDHHFCNSVCYGEWQKVARIGLNRNRTTVQCDVCGAEVERRPCEVRARNFCGNACLLVWRRSGAFTGPNNASWLGGNVDYRGPNWNRQRKAARLRDNDTCQHCGHVAPSQPVHHKRPFHLFDDYRVANDLGNLETLCPPCHAAADNLFWQQYPDLVQSRRFPNCAPVKECRQCGADFTPRSGAAEICDACCTSVCLHCGQPFYSRRASYRSIKYCSRACRHAAVKAQSKPRRKSSPTT